MKKKSKAIEDKIDNILEEINNKNNSKGRLIRFVERLINAIRSGD